MENGQSSRFWYEFDMFTNMVFLFAANFSARRLLSPRTTPSIVRSLSLYLSLSLALALSLALSNYLALSLALSRSLSLALSLFLALSLSHTHTLTHSRSLSDAGPESAGEVRLDAEEQARGRDAHTQRQEHLQENGNLIQRRFQVMKFITQNCLH